MENPVTWQDVVDKYLEPEQATVMQVVAEDTVLVIVEEAVDLVEVTGKDVAKED